MDQLSDDTRKNESMNKRSTVLIFASIIAFCFIGFLGVIYLIVNISKKTSPPLLASPTPPLPASPTPGTSFRDPEEELSTAMYYILNQNNCDMAVPLLDDVIARTPDNGDAYFYRSYCYYGLTKHQTIESIQRENTLLALKDIDSAISYGTDPSLLAGNPYYLRYMIFDAIQGYMDLRSDRDYIKQLMLENLETSIALGNSDRYSHRTPPLIYFALNRCDEGLLKLDGIRQQEGLSAPPSASLYNMEAQGYLCSGDFEKALEYVDRGLALDVQPERLYLRAIILYHLGKLDDSLEVLNQLIEERPNYSGIRYLLRASIQYEMGNRELAEQDLLSGQGNSWGGGGLDYYVLGQMAMDDNDKELAIQYLQQADAELVWQYYPLLSKIKDKLQSLGAKPLPQEATADIVSTPMADPPLLRPVPQYPINSYGFQLPPNPISVDMKDGSGPLNINGDKYFTYRFHTSTPVSIESAQKLTVHISPSTESKEIPIFVLLWQPATGDWTIVSTTPKDVEVENPNLYVDNSGVVYISIFTPQGRSIALNNFWVTLEASTIDGSKIVLDLGKSP